MLENPTGNTRVEDGRDVPQPASTARTSEHVELKRHAHQLGPGLALRARLGLGRGRVRQRGRPCVAHDLGAELGVGCEHTGVEHEVDAWLGNLRGKPLEMIRGQPPNLATLPVGCAFAPRCNYAVDRCHKEDSSEIELDAGRIVRCIRAEAPPKPVTN